ncbi:MAG TPA: hypothetical protein VKM94_13700 [Blastocatellia bacterium]|nr:hypothetical protein [Blastocatellia bacterium]
MRVTWLARIATEMRTVDELSLDDIKTICESIPVRAINLGTGENALHSEFRQILAYLKERKVKIT